MTIFGESAGSMSVMYHYLSPQSKGLFKSAIAQSGSATSSFLKVDKNPVYYARSVFCYNFWYVSTNLWKTRAQWPLNVKSTAKYV